MCGAHIAGARTREAEETDASILNILDRLGEPDELVSEARQRPNPSRSGRQSGAPGPYRPGAMEIAAGGLRPFIGPVGVRLRELPVELCLGRGDQLVHRRDRAGCDWPGGG